MKPGDVQVYSVISAPEMQSFSSPTAISLTFYVIVLIQDAEETSLAT